MTSFYPIRGRGRDGSRADRLRSPELVLPPLGPLALHVDKVAEVGDVLQNGDSCKSSTSRRTDSRTGSCTDS